MWHHITAELNFYRQVSGRYRQVLGICLSTAAQEKGFDSASLRGGGGGGFRPIILETLILKYGLKGEARTRPQIFRVVLGPCAQFYPCKASEQKWGKKNKI